MKTTTTILLAFILALSAHVAVADTVDSYHSSWHLVRASADEDGATFAAVYDLTTSGNFANKDSSTVANGGPFKITSKATSPRRGEGASAGGAWMLSLAGKNYNNVDDTFSFTLVGWSKLNGMLQVLCEGDAVLGTQAVVLYPNDGSDALGELVSVTAGTYTHGTTTFVDTADVGGFAGTVAGMMAYVTGSNLTDGYYQVTTVTDANTIIMSGMASTNNNTDSTIQINPAFWADTINLDETTKLPSVSVLNSGDNETAMISVDTTGLEWIQLVVYDADAATGEQAGDVAAFGRMYSSGGGGGGGGLTDAELTAQGLATSAKQLADGHNTTNDNAGGTAAVEVQMTSPVKTTTISVVDDWKLVTAAATIVPGNVADLTGAYGTSYLYVDAAYGETSANTTGIQIIVQTSTTGTAPWTEYTSVRGTAETAATTTLNGAVTADDGTITLTDATTADFKIKGRTWFILDGTVADSEAVTTMGNSTHVVTIGDGAQRSHNTGLSVFDRVDSWEIPIPEAFPYARVLPNADDDDTNMYVTVRSQVTTAR